MGVVEDTEPPLKRAKRLADEPNGFSANSSVRGSSVNSNSLGDLMARPLPSQGDDETIGSKGVIRKSEFVRIITRALYSLGYDKTGAMLEEESGISLHNSTIKLFLQQVKDGKWDQSVKTLHRIGFPDEKAVKAASFLLLEQKFLEFLKVEKIADALRTLRNEMAPLRINTKRVHELASSLISPSSFISHTTSTPGKESVNSRSKVLEELQTLLPASVIIPEKRLECLVENSLHIQRDSCVFHNTLDSDLSLYSDHQCGKHQIPSQTAQILESHTDEVWFLQFSHNGKYLASSSKDQTAIIWEISADGHISLKHTLVGHHKPVIAILWSPDDRQVLTCGAEEVIRRWDVDSGDCVHMYEKGGISPISCGWYPDGQGIIAGMTDRSICMWDLDGREKECWKGQRTQKVSDIAMTDDGKWLVSVCKDSVISLFDREATVERLIEEEDMITSFSLSNDNKYILVNLLNQEIRLWNIEGDPKIVSRYKGHKRSRFIIRSCFGGYKQAFIASGSEDSQVYIWHRSTGKLIVELPGHAGAVNCVSWSPTNLHMLASASDDGTIRIWGLDRINQQNQKKKLVQGSSSNGVIHRCNGN
ncbi:WD-repeat protein-like [Arabidopsis thaliana]|uniref:WD repeat-containing protein 26 homolog n=2 Tax=Arabidopsis thaliana TaxID=3702 RepID=WDR26_ARATH|nr:transducin family protein / WD-40 repeat family protein [Arabidopsis thaliana]NP_001318513.1 transducin family protein / WD-40 repeat family protein [Arabidopsis thaliana]NP_196473.1 transducin family protein / WD-40 repeat family protein [Arabidopsis thaliana]Q9FNN2.1 RecName: Full=WD repeat-containing protein 26 homolog; Short=AtWDR26 [Arabidopsis thaliana]AAK96726.1 WD-repeat protein-like [Arabidopsis thaliana]AAL47352.1 WD-repeat protein-like [Arabidopsis thaliana]AED91320.1 transducin|eukprot:NP_001078546.1 transducin family protein / WD-40 repeat family protein [Arabidopsis thaliana]